MLKAFTAAERKDLPILVGDAADAVEQIVAEGLTPAQNRFHAALTLSALRAPTRS